VAELAKDTREWELDDLVSAQLAARGCYLETSVKEKSPDELLDLDIVWTDYRKEREEPHPVQVKKAMHQRLDASEMARAESLS
jgi:hypothetical protein